MGTRAAARRRGHDRRSGRARAVTRPRRADPARGGRGVRARRLPPTRSRTRSGRSSARPRIPGRVAVAMSGGVDSAVALLHAGPSAVGVTLRLWLDPEGPSAERACCSPDAVIAAREACHALGRPHVTLDLREEFRRAIVEPFVRGYERGETPNPCIACNGSFRFAELLAFAERVGAARLATGHYARIVSHRGRLLLARAVDREKDQSYMLGRLDPAFLDRIWFPLGEQTKAETRAEAEAAGLSGCATRREPGGLLPRRRRLPLVPRAPRAERRGPDLGRGRARARQARRGLALHARPAPRAWRLVRGSALRAQDRRGDLDARRRAPGVARHDERLGPRAAVRRRGAGRGEAPLPLARGRRPSGRREERGFRLELDQPAFAVAAGQAAVLYDGDAVVGSGLITSAADA